MTESTMLIAEDRRESPRRPRLTSHSVVRWMLGLILLAAAGLEGHRLATEPVLGKGLFSHRWALMGLVEFEIFLGVWLLTGLYRRLAWITTLACFLIFSAVSLTKGLQGEASCGCFGKLTVNPWHTFTLDVAAVTALLLFRPELRTGVAASHVRLRLGAGLTILAATGVPLGIAMVSYRPAVLSEQGALVGQGQIVLLEPEAWPGKPFPLLRHIDVGQKLSRGPWVVMLFRNCSGCAEALPRYKKMAKNPTGQKRFSVAVIAMPPDEQSHAPGPADDGLLWGKLDARQDWFVTAPTVAVLVDGVVKAAWEGTAPDLESLLEPLR